MQVDALLGPADTIEDATGDLAVKKERRKNQYQNQCKFLWDE